jgi:2'-5' RNA ligase
LRLFVGAYPPPDVVADLAALVAGLELGRPQPEGHSLRLVAPDRWHLTLAFLGEIPDGRLGAVMNALQPVSRLPTSHDRASRERASRERALPERALRESASRESASRERASPEPTPGPPASSEPTPGLPASPESALGPPASSEPTAGLPASREPVLGAPIRVSVAGGGKFGRSRFTTVWAGLDGELDGLRGLAAAIRRELKRARLPFDAKPFRPHITLARPGDRLPAEALARDLAALQSYRGPEWTVADVRLVRSFLGPEPRYETLAAIAA